MFDLLMHPKMPLESNKAQKQGQKDLVPIVTEFIAPAEEELQCTPIKGYSQIELKILSRIFYKVKSQPDRRHQGDKHFNELWKLEFTDEERELLRKFVRASDYQFWTMVEDRLDKLCSHLTA